LIELLKPMKNFYQCFALLILALPVVAQVNPKLQVKLDQQAKELESRVIEWRRKFHQNPELGNREVKTGAIIAEHLKSIGIKVQHPVAKTGVVGILEGGKPGPVIALRADMDALPIMERNGLTFASKEKTIFNGQETGVMHACGHDAHMAIMMAVAEILANNKSELKGTVKFLFQPAEEGPPAGEEGGALLMVKEGVLENPKVEVIFGLHMLSLLPSGQLGYRSEGIMAASDGLKIKVLGVGAHGATPWESKDPIIVASQIMSGLQTIISRQTDLTKAPAVITIGSFHSGNRGNIIPEVAEMQGTIRTFDLAMRKTLLEKVRLTAEKIAESSGLTAIVEIGEGSPITYNDPKLTVMMTPSLQRTVGINNAIVVAPTTLSEDFSVFQENVPGLFFFLGAYPTEMKLSNSPVHHTADFIMDEKAFVTGVRTLVNLTIDYMYATKK
jgi:amidohydrolase